MSATGFDIDLRDVHFVLFEQLDVHQELSSYERYADFDVETYKAMIDEAMRIAKEVIWPLNGPGDRQGCTFHGDGVVTTPEGYKEAWKLLSEGGWIAFAAPFEEGGSNLPEPVAMAVGEIHTGAGPALSTYGGLTRGAANLLSHHADDFLKEMCVERLNTGEWSGTMCLTEAGAGSSVGDNRAKAVPADEEGVFMLTGEKIFISGGDHDLTDNIVHLVLARLPDAPNGTKGLSIFAVPKFGFPGTSFEGQRNGAYVVGIEHKMGLNGSATCTLELGGTSPCHGYLIGRPGDGMRIMFHLMNEARIAVGIQGLSSAAAAYENARSYAAERIQGTSIKSFKDPNAQPVTIDQHPDVRRMLMDMRVSVELMRSLLYTTALRLTIAENTDDEDVAKAKIALVELLTPICKGYCTDLGFEVTVTALQTFGGYGYIQEYPVEQHCRDSKIASIYEGTNGIQAMDLLGRKMRAQNGMVFMNWMNQTNQEINAAKATGVLDEQAAAVQKSVGFLGAAAMHLGKLGMEGDLEGAMLQATPFLELFGLVVLGVHALEQARVAHERSKVNEADAAFYRGKRLNLDWYCANRLPKAVALSKAIQAADTSCMDESLFGARD